MWSALESDSSQAQPRARCKHAAAVLGPHVYVVGGRGAGGAVPLRDFWRYHLATGVWERLTTRGQAPPALMEHSATPHGARLYVFGGEPGTSSAETPLWIFDIETMFWRKLPGQADSFMPARRRGVREQRTSGVGPRGRRGHSAHALKDCLLIYGGYKDLRGSTNELWAFHYESESWQQVRTAGPGPARHRHAAALHDARLYVHAGMCDLRECADLWHYDTISRTWSAVRTPARLSPPARSGHAGLRAGGHFYIFGGEAGGHPTNELWRFHFATETWERMEQGLKCPSPRVDAVALLVAGDAPRARSAPAPSHLPPGPASAPPAGLLREIGKLSSFHMRRAQRCSYTVLGERDSTESLARQLPKSHSSYVIDARQPGDGGESPREADVAEYRDLAREPISVPDFADMILPTPVLSPIEATKLVYLDSEDEEEVRREETVRRREPAGRGEGRVVALPKSASVRFTADSVTVTTEEDEALSTSDYASAERVNRLSGFSNPHYLGPDVRRLGAALTPDSGVGAGDIELRPLGNSSSNSNRGGRALHVLVVGGREAPHVARLTGALSLWTYRLL